MKFRFKVTLAFLAVIVLPFIIGVIAFAISLPQVEDLPQLKVFQRNDEMQMRFVERVASGFSFIEDYEAFSEHMSPLLEEYKANVIVTDLKRNLLFDSESKIKTLDRPVIDEMNFERIGANNGIVSSLSLDKEAVLVNYPVAIVVDEQVVGQALISANQTSAVATLATFVATSLAKSFAFGFLSMVGLVIILSWWVSRSILSPLKQLNVATHKIAQGDLNFAVDYQRNDELGRFCQRFDLMRQKLKDSLEQQAQEKRLRKEMIASISHDLRTPISSIKGYVEGLQDGIAQDENTRNRYLGVIKNKSEQLNHLIEDLFQFSQLDIGNLPLHLDRCNSEELFEELLQDFQIQCAYEGCQLQIIRPIPAADINVDAHRIEQVMDNLLQNACKYAGEDVEVVISFTLQVDCLKITFEDNGPGLPAEDIPFVFERFYRGEKSRSRNHGGAGLGLSICKAIIKKHGGDIWVESHPGDGAAVSFTLPLASN